MNIIMNCYNEIMREIMRSTRDRLIIEENWIDNEN